MKRGRSTGKPTKAESAHIVAVKESNCITCALEGLHNPFEGCDAHHTLSGGRRRGHMFILGLCPWHHRGVPLDGMSTEDMRVIYGPSLMDGSKVFRDAYGTDDDLLEAQHRLLKTGSLL